MARAPSLKVIERNEPILEKLLELKAEHPFWGYRCIWAHLTYVNNLQINKKRACRFMKIHGLIVTKNTQLKTKSTAARTQHMGIVLPSGRIRITRNKRRQDHHQKPESTLRKYGLAKLGAIQTF